MECKMTNQKIPPEEARSALADVKEIEDSTTDKFKNPPSKNAAISLFFGLFSCAVAFDGVAFWNYVALIITLFFAPLLILGFFYLRKLGVKPKLIPHSLSGKILSYGMMVFFVAVIFSGEAFYVAGCSWAPYLAGLANAVVYSICMWKAPLGEWVSEKGEV